MINVAACAFLNGNQYLENMEPTKENLGFGENLSYGIELFQVVNHNWGIRLKLYLIFRKLIAQYQFNV